MHKTYSENLPEMTDNGLYFKDYLKDNPNVAKESNCSQ